MSKKYILITLILLLSYGCTSEPESRQISQYDTEDFQALAKIIAIRKTNNRAGNHLIKRYGLYARSVPAPIPNKEPNRTKLVKYPR